MGQYKFSDTASAELAASKEANASLESRLKDEASAHACTKLLLQEHIIRAEDGDKLSLVLDRMPVMMTAFDRDGKCVAWNGECERVTGYSAEEMVGTPNVHELAIPDPTHRARMLELWTSKRDSRDWEVEFTAKDGRILTIAWSNVPGKFAIRDWSTWSVGVDVTARNRVEAALEKSRGELKQKVTLRTLELEKANANIAARERTLDGLKESERRLLDSQRVARIGTFEHDLRTGEMVWTDEVFRLLGFEPGEVDPCIATYLERVHPDDAEIVLQAQLATQRGEQPLDSVRRIVLPDGSIRVIDTVANIVRDEGGRPIRVIRTMQDITDRVRADEALRTSQSMFECAFESSPSLASIVNAADRRLLKVNDAWCKRLGYNREDVVGKTTDELGIWADARSQHRIRDELDRRGVVRSFPTELRSALGDTVFVEAFADALEFEGGEAIFTVAHDMTERKRYEDALWEAKENAELANRTKSEFLANVSHELRTPLNAILGFSDMMSMGVAGPLTEKQSDYISDIHQSGEYLLSLIGDLIDLSTIELGKMNLDLEQVDLETCVDECVTQMRARIEEAGIRLCTSDFSGLPPIRADKRRIKQILLNLLSNASKFTNPDGEITIDGTLTDNRECAIVVRDTGVGMTQAMINGASTAFRRGDDPMLRNSEGAGLGLSLVYSMVGGHGGRVAIKSALGQGTAVTVTFPMDGPPEQGAGRSSRTRRAALSTIGSEGQRDED